MRLRAIDVRLRAAALLPAGMLAVHQLRYQLAYGDGAAHALARQGHAYLAGALPFALAPAALGLSLLLARLTRAWQGRVDERRPAAGLLRTTLFAATALLALYVVQESLEGLLAAGHPAGLAGVFGAGGWIAVPLAALIAGAIALALRCADAIVARLAAQRPAPRRAGRARRPASPPRPSASARRWRLDPACGPIGDRPPPARAASPNAALA